MDWFYFKLKALHISVRLQQCILDTSQYLSAPEVVPNCVFIPACLNTIFSFIGSTRRRNELSHCTNLLAEPGRAHPTHSTQPFELPTFMLPPSCQASSTPGECWKRALAAGHFSITSANRGDASEEGVVQNFLDNTCCNESYLSWDFFNRTI